MGPRDHYFSNCQKLWTGAFKDRLTHTFTFVGRVDALVESIPFDRRAAGSNPAIPSTQGPWVSPSLAVACSASACLLRHMQCELLWSAALLEGSMLMLWEAL